MRKGRGQLSQLETDLVEANDPKKQKYQVQPLTTPYDPLRPPTRPSQTYERRAIEQWLAGERERGAVPVSPLTGEPLKDTTLRPNFLARELGWVAGPE